MCSAGDEFAVSFICLEPTSTILNIISTYVEVYAICLRPFNRKV